MSGRQWQGWRVQQSVPWAVGDLSRPSGEGSWDPTPRVCSFLPALGTCRVNFRWYPDHPKSGQGKLHKITLCRSPSPRHLQAHDL